MRVGILRRLFRHDAASGVVLMLASAAALVLANSPLAGSYDLLLSVHGLVRIGDFGIDKPLLLWINDGLMVIFFIGRARNQTRGSRRRALRPKAGDPPRRRGYRGMIVPALIYLGTMWNTPGTTSGWAIPSATDIAFSLGVMALLGRRVPASLKLFLMALAIIDDLGRSSSSPSFTQRSSLGYRLTSR